MAERIMLKHAEGWDVKIEFGEHVPSDVKNKLADMLIAFASAKFTDLKSSKRRRVSPAGVKGNGAKAPVARRAKRRKE